MYKVFRTLKLLQIISPQNEIELSSRLYPFISVGREFTSSSSLLSTWGHDDSNDSNRSFEFEEEDQPARDQGKFWLKKRFHHPSNRNDFHESWRPRRHPRFRDYSDFEHQDGLQMRQALGSRLKTHDWKSAKLNSFEKNFYASHPSVSARSQEEMDAFYDKHNISVTNDEKPMPIFHFQEANFPESIDHRLRKTGWSEPTAIQSIGWPLALSGKNLVGIAQTGSGKTLGFLLPAIVHIRHQRPVERGGEPIIVVLAPTRELAQQIHEVANQFCQPMGIRSSCVFGGQSKLIQARNLLRGQELLVATPGRLIDFIEEEIISLGRTTYIVLDEADRMLDMGFEPQIRKILSQIRPDRQMLMWTATWPEEIQSLAHDFLGDFTQVNIGSAELTVNPNIKQIIRICDHREKFERFLHEFQSLCISPNGFDVEKTLIFVNTQLQADMLARKLQYKRIRAKSIHGRKTQSYRENVLDNFRRGHVKVLVATDVAARGLDVDDVKVVFNYDLSPTIDDYIHRIGRTARASKTGIAVSFCTVKDSSMAKDLISTLKRTDQDIPDELKDLAYLHSKYNKKGAKKSLSKRYPYTRDFRPRGIKRERIQWVSKDMY